MRKPELFPILIFALILLAAPAVAAGNPWLLLVDDAEAEGFADAEVSGSYVYAVGLTNSTGPDFDVFILKATTSGALVWAKVLDFADNETYAQLAVAPWGSIYLLASNGTHSYIANITPNGLLAWAYELTVGDVATHATGLYIDAPNNTLLVSGLTIDTTAGKNLFVAELSRDGTLGTVLLAGINGSTILPAGWDVIRGGDGYVYVVGFSNADSTPTPGDPATYKHVIVLRLLPDLSGADNVAVYNWTIADYAYRIRYYDGSLYIVGEIRQDTYGNDILVASLDPATLSLSWAERVNISYVDEGWSLEIVNGTLLVAGALTYGYPGLSNYNGIIAGMATNGSLLWSYNLTGDKLDILTIATGMNGLILVAGATNTTGSGAASALMAAILPERTTFTIDTTTFTLEPSNATVTTAVPSPPPDYTWSFQTATGTLTPVSPTVTPWSPTLLYTSITTVGGQIINSDNGLTGNNITVAAIALALLAASLVLGMRVTRKA